MSDLSGLSDAELLQQLGTPAPAPAGAAGMSDAELLAALNGGAPAAPAGPSLLARAGDAVQGVEERLGIGQPAAPAAPQQSFGDRVGGMVGGALGVLDQGARGLAQGAVSLAGLPVDAVNYAPVALNYTPAGFAARYLGGMKGFGPITDRPVFGSQFNRDALDTLNERTTDATNALSSALGGSGAAPYPNKEPRNVGERVANRVGQEIGAMALPVGGGLEAAAVLGREGVKRLPAAARLFAEPAAVNPAAFLRKEIQAAGAAGLGASGVNELTRALGVKDDGLGHAAGDLAGALGGLGLYGIASHAGPKIADVFNAVRGDPNFANRVAKEGAVDTLAEAAGLPSARLGEKGATDVQPIVDAIERGRSVGETVPGFRESLADRTQNPGLAGLEYSRQSGPNSGLFATRRGENVEAVAKAVDSLQPTGTPGALRGELESRRTGLLQDAATERRTSQSRFEEAAGRLQSAMHADARGADIRAPLEDALTAAREVEHGAWNGIGGELPAAPLAARFARIQDSLTEPERRIVGDMAGAIGTPGRLAPGAGAADPLEAMTQVRRAPPAEDVTDLREITSLRSEFTTAQRQAATQGDGNKARLLGQYIDSIDAHLAEHAPEAQAAIEQARATSRDLNDRFTRPQTAIAQTLNRTEGQYRLPDSGVAKRFVVPDDGDVSGFEALTREAGADPRTRTALRDQVLADVEGLRGPEQVDAYLRDHGRVLGHFPELRQQIEEATGLRRSAEAATARETDLTRSLGTENTRGASSVGRYLHHGDEASATAMRGVLNAPKPAQAADELLNFAGNTPQAVEGARRNFWDVMQSEARSKGSTTASVGGVQPWMPGPLKAFLDNPRNAAVAERLYRDDPEHLENLRKISDAIQGVDVRARAKAPNTSGTAQGVSPILSPETIQSRLYAYKRGQVSGTFLITSIAAVAARRGVAKAQSSAINRLVDEALLNPDAAAVLLRENNPANRALLARKAKGWIGNEAGTVFDALDSEDEDPVKAAVTRKTAP